MELADRIKDAIRDVPDFPKKGIIFKDITPVLTDHELCNDIADEFVQSCAGQKIDAIACIDARGFLFGMLISQKMGVPFIPVRKAGKLPYKKITESYALEYGTAEVELHEDAIQPGWNVLIHDDLLATGGTAEAAAKLVSKHGKVAGFSFLVNLSFLNGAQKLSNYSQNIISLVEY